MNKLRLTTLADGIFAIVMTLMVLNLKVPELIGLVSSQKLWSALLMLTPAFVSYILSFAVLTNYWMAHHYVVSIYAQNIDRRLIFWNMSFLMAISLIPFSAHLLGSYVTTPLSIWFFSLHIIVIGALLHHLFYYTLRATNIRNSSAITQKDIQLTYIRIFIPPICAVLAVYLSFFNTKVSIYFLVFAVVFNLLPGVLHRLDRILGTLLTKQAIQKRVLSVRVQTSRNHKKVAKVAWVIK
ncbi:MAG: TMEM175 family protein [bacterium]|nr:TMEM175 family protein [bacterium]